MYQKKYEPFINDLQMKKKKPTKGIIHVTSMKRYIL